jgi:Protein of unknown function (DUF2726)
VVHLVFTRSLFRNEAVAAVWQLHPTFFATACTIEPLLCNEAYEHHSVRVFHFGRRGVFAVASQSDLPGDGRHFRSMYVDLVRMSPRRQCRFRRSTRTRFSVFRRRRSLLTPNESAFLRVLLRAVRGRYLISCKVRLADLVTCSEYCWRRGHANRIAQKHVDFVLSHVHSLRIVAIIELDDASHRRPDRRRRDRFVDQLFQRTGFALLRIPATWQYDEQTVRYLLETNGLLLGKEIDHGSISPKPINLRRSDPSS